MTDPPKPIQRFGNYFAPTRDGPVARRLGIEVGEYLDVIGAFMGTLDRKIREDEVAFLGANIVRIPPPEPPVDPPPTPEVYRALREWIERPLGVEGHPDPDRWERWRQERFRLVTGARAERQAQDAFVAAARKAIGDEPLEAREQQWLDQACREPTHEEAPTDRVWGIFRTAFRVTVGDGDSQAATRFHAGLQFTYMNTQRARQEREHAEPAAPVFYGKAFPGVQCADDPQVRDHEAQCGEVEAAELDEVIADFTTVEGRPPDTDVDLPTLTAGVVTATSPRLGPGSRLPSAAALGAIHRWVDRDQPAHAAEHPVPLEWKNESRFRYQSLLARLVELRTAEALIEVLEARDRSIVDDDRDWIRQFVTGDAACEGPTSEAAWIVVDEWVTAGYRDPEHPHPAVWDHNVRQRHAQIEHDRLILAMASDAVAWVSACVPLAEDDQLAWVLRSAGGPESGVMPAIVDHDVCEAFEEWAATMHPAEVDHPFLTAERERYLHEYRELKIIDITAQVLGRMYRALTRENPPQEVVGWFAEIATRESYRGQIPPPGPWLDCAVEWFSRATPPIAGYDAEAWEVHRSDMLGLWASHGLLGAGPRGGIPGPGGLEA